MRFHFHDIIVVREPVESGVRRWEQVVVSFQLARVIKELCSEV